MPSMALALFAKAMLVALMAAGDCATNALVVSLMAAGDCAPNALVVALMAVGVAKMALQ